ncbi:VOC family protein [Dokdonella soli]|uniref:VOC family protein n=1 Tax=Dokdonella soli TaxID=529810 RepID=A0ABP3TL37_9GAMM
MLNPNVPAWFEIPTSDLDRAQRFYETVLDVELERENFGGGTMAVFPGGNKPNSRGALVRMPHCEPSFHGSTIYLSLSDIRPALERVAQHGGDVFVPRTELPDGIGFFAQIRDSEGNRVGLWSPA